MQLSTLLLAFATTALAGDWAANQYSKAGCSDADEIGESATSTIGDGTCISIDNSTVAVKLYNGGGVNDKWVMYSGSRYGNACSGDEGLYV
ncbi:Uu.00g062950.m01.CDS01 [Anthostomella pinea]|uniref:Uu.00g062950.m01.CDS01 n=1 Tax=Anthostomella pinea TaxID=933095 RepID=A0AAI8YMZ8_9PEZI|nr:Uu.00g062950.m01.CDS01 [Anthostomella pinea]